MTKSTDANFLRRVLTCTSVDVNVDIYHVLENENMRVKIREWQD